MVTYQMTFKNTTAFVKNTNDVFYWVNKAGAIITDKMRQIISSDLLAFTGAYNSIAIGNNPGNPSVTVRKVDKVLYSVQYAQRINKTFEKVRQMIPEDCQAYIHLKEGKISLCGPMFYDSICGNGWMHSYIENLKFSNNGYLKGYTSSDNTIAKDIYKALKNYRQ